MRNLIFIILFMSFLKLSISQEIKISHLICWKDDNNYYKQKTPGFAFNITDSIISFGTENFRQSFKPYKIEIDPTNSDLYYRCHNYFTIVRSNNKIILIRPDRQVEVYYEF